MDNFMDKIAQKFNASELIKANSQAEAEEMKRLQRQIAEYEGILQEMRKLNLRNMEVTDRIETQMERLVENNAKIVEDTLREIKEVVVNNPQQEPVGVLEETRKLLEEGQLKTEELFKSADEYVHRENVKVYRNVQAVVVEEMKNQAEVFIADNQKLNQKIIWLKIFTIVSVIFSIANTVLLVFQMFF